MADHKVADVKVFVANLSRNKRDAFRRAGIESSGISVIEYHSRAKRLSTYDVLEDTEAAKLVSSFQPPSRRQVALQLYEQLQEFDPDIVHAWLDNTIYVSGLVSALLPKARLVGRWGSLPPTVQRESSPQERNHATVLRHAYLSLIKESKVQLYSNSRGTAEFYADWIGVPRSEILVVKNGIDFSSFERSEAARQRIRSKLGIDPDAVVIGTAIRLGSEKRPFMWLDIAEKVAAQRSGAAFVIVGDGPLLDEVRRRAKTLKHAKVHIVGRQMNIADWYNAMDVTLMTSSVEGLSNTVIESAYMELPVVAYDVGGMAEAVHDGDTGFLLPEGDVEGAVNALVRLIDDSELLADMGAKAHDFAADNFNPEKMTDSVMAIYDELLKR
jgi:glycosyltransferase involved in cell wall biosynthesis